MSRKKGRTGGSRGGKGRAGAEGATAAAAGIGGPRWLPRFMLLLGLGVAAQYFAQRLTGWAGWAFLLVSLVIAVGMVVYLILHRKDMLKGG